MMRIMLLVVAVLGLSGCVLESQMDACSKACGGKVESVSLFTCTCAK